MNDFPINEIVYLDQNFKTFKYFLTGQFENKHDEDQDYKPKFQNDQMQSGAPDNFLKQLNTLN